MSATRSRTPEAPYCWQSKTVRKSIRDDYDGDHFGTAVLAVYDALTEIASDEQSETFTTLQSHIAKKACLGVTTVKKALPELRRLATISYATPKLRGAITFTLLAATRLTIAATRPTLAKTRIHPSLATVEESKKNLFEKSFEDSSNGSRPSRRNPSSRIQLVDEEHIRELKQIYQPRDVDKAVADCKAWLLTPKGKGKAFSKRRLQTFLRDAESLQPEAQTSTAREQIDRTAIDPDKFKSFLASQYPAGIEKGWTPETAPEGVIQNFLNDRKVVAA